jgi:general secretion pathway protein J
MKAMSASRPASGSAARRPLQPGLTLIELVVALAIFALLGVLSYRALAEVSTSQTRLEEGFQRWRSIGRCMQRIDNDLLQGVAPAAPPGVLRSPALVLVQGTRGEPELQLLRIDHERGVRRVGFRLRDGQLDWLRWSGREPVGEPEHEKLLGGVRAMRWSFLYSGIRTDRWPPEAGSAPASTDGSTELLPDAVILELDLADVGTVTRIVALR